jgi:hypothetical protein
MGLESYIRDSITGAHNLVMDFEEGGKIVINRYSWNGLHQHELFGKELDVLP